MRSPRWPPEKSLLRPMGSGGEIRRRLLRQPRTGSCAFTRCSPRPCAAGRPRHRVPFCRRPGPSGKPWRGRCARRGLANVRFQPAQPRTRSPRACQLRDVHLVTLRPGCERLVLPQQTVRHRRGRPGRWFTSVRWNVNWPARSSRRGFGVAVPRRPASLAGAIRGVEADPARRSRHGNAAARWCARDRRTGGGHHPMGGIAGPRPCAGTPGHRRA